MKSTTKILGVVLLMSALSACTVKSTKSTTTTSSGSSSLGTGDTGSTGGTGGSTTTGGITCDGVNNNGASVCYYTIPTIQVMGFPIPNPNPNVPFWSSTSLASNGSGFSMQRFVTDTVFNVRIIPRMAIKTNPAVNPSVPGKSCNNLLSSNYIASKLYVQLKLQTQAEANSGGGGEVATLQASIDQPSPVWHFSRRVGGGDPLVLKVITVLTDSRCRQPSGSGYCPYSDLPLSSAGTTAPTECVAFDVQFSTDETWDLPGASAN